MHADLPTARVTGGAGPTVVPERLAERRQVSRDTHMYNCVVSHTVLHLGDSGRRIRDGGTLLST